MLPSNIRMESFLSVAIARGCSSLGTDEAFRYASGEGRPLILVWRQFWRASPAHAFYMKQVMKTDAFVTSVDFLRDWRIATELFASNEDAVNSQCSVVQKISLLVCLISVLPTQAFAEIQQVQADVLGCVAPALGGTCQTDPPRHMH